MATWISFQQGKNETFVCDLDRIAAFRSHNNGLIQLLLSGGGVIEVKKRDNPDAYQKVLEYLGRLKYS